MRFALLTYAIGREHFYNLKFLKQDNYHSFHIKTALVHTLSPLLNPYICVCFPLPCAEINEYTPLLLCKPSAADAQVVIGLLLGLPGVCHELLLLADVAPQDTKLE